MRTTILFMIIVGIFIINLSYETIANIPQTDITVENEFEKYTGFYQYFCDIQGMEDRLTLLESKMDKIESCTLEKNSAKMVTIDIEESPDTNNCVDGIWRPSVKNRFRLFK